MFIIANSQHFVVESLAEGSRESRQHPSAACLSKQSGAKAAERCEAERCKAERCKDERCSCISWRMASPGAYLVETPAQNAAENILKCEWALSGWKGCHNKVFHVQWEITVVHRAS